MKTIHTEIKIAATAERVWHILADFAAYPEWNPFIQRAAGRLETGARLEVCICPPGSSGMTFRPVVRIAEPCRELCWEGRLLLRSLFDGEHRFRIESVAPERVRFIQSEVFTGLLVPLFARTLDTATRQGFEEMNRALKTRAEAGAR